MVEGFLLHCSQTVKSVDFCCNAHPPFEMAIAIPHSGSIYHMRKLDTQNNIPSIDSMVQLFNGSNGPGIDWLWWRPLS